MNVDVSTLFESHFYRILNFKCLCVNCLTSDNKLTKSINRPDQSTE